MKDFKGANIKLRSESILSRSNSISSKEFQSLRNEALEKTSKSTDINLNSVVSERTIVSEEKYYDVKEDKCIIMLMWKINIQVLMLY